MTALATAVVLRHGGGCERLIDVLRSAGAVVRLHALPDAGGDSARDAWGDAGIVFVASDASHQGKGAYLDEGGLLSSARSDQLLVDIGGLGPLDIREIAQAAHAAGKRFVDVRLLGDSLACWGGPVDAWSDHEGVLEALGAARFHLGEAGSATVAATTAAQVALLNLAGSREGLVLGAKAGMDTQTLTQVIMLSSGSSPSLTAALRAPGFGDVRATLTIERARQELEQALDLGRRLCLPTPLAALTHGWLQSLCRQGRGAEPVAALGDLYESLAGLDTSRPTGEARAAAEDQPSAQNAQPRACRVGFIGLGRIGLPMASSILRAGHDLVVHNRSRAAVDRLVAHGAQAASGPREIAEECEVIVTCLPDNHALESVYWGRGGLLSGTCEGRDFVDAGTSSFALTLRIAEAVRERGGLFLDAPVSGGLDKAETGELTIMVGAREAALGASRPVLSAMGSEIFFLGATGRGQVTKQVNNMLNATNFAAACEGLALAVAAGLDADRIFSVLSHPELASFALAFRGRRIVRGDYGPTYTTVLRIKDSLAALELGQTFRVPLPLCAVVHELFEASVALGWGGEDWTSLAKVYELVAGVTLSAPSRPVEPAH